jgi:enoyl-CoA hydratase
VTRPEALNALDTETLKELRSRLTQLGDDEECRVVVLTGEGEQSFIAGADIREMRSKTLTDAREFARMGQDCARQLETMPKPTIAAVNGYCLGGGFEMALACDLRYASTTAVFGQPEVNLGLIPGWGGTQRLARLAGLGVAKELVLSGRTMSAQEAYEHRLVHGLAEPAQLPALVAERAALLAAKSPVALARAKRALNAALGGDHRANLQLEADQFASLFSTSDAREGMAAFLEKRDPRFTGR